MGNERRSNELIRMFLEGAKNFTPIMVSADFRALTCPPCRKKDTEELISPFRYKAHPPSPTPPPQGVGMQGEVLDAA